MIRQGTRGQAGGLRNVRDSKRAEKVTPYQWVGKSASLRHVPQTCRTCLAWSRGSRCHPSCRPCPLRTPWRRGCGAHGRARMAQQRRGALQELPHFAPAPPRRPDTSTQSTTSQRVTRLPNASGTALTPALLSSTKGSRDHTRPTNSECCSSIRCSEIRRGKYNDSQQCQQVPSSKDALFKMCGSWWLTRQSAAVTRPGKLVPRGGSSECSGESGKTLCVDCGRCYVCVQFWTLISRHSI